MGSGPEWEQWASGSLYCVLLYCVSSPLGHCFVLLHGFARTYAGGWGKKARGGEGEGL